MKLFRTLAVASLLSLSACIDMDEAVTIYLHPDGSLDFIGYLDAIRSDAKDPAEQAKDEKEFLRDFRSGKFVAAALREAGSRHVKTELLRTSVPYAAIVRGTHPDVASFFRVFDFNLEAGKKTAKLAKDGARRSLTFHFPPPESQAAKPSSRDDFPKRLKLVLAEGRFTDAAGFTLSEDKRICELDRAKADELRAKREPADLFCAWK